MPSINRRHPAALALLILFGLFFAGTAFAAVSPKQADATATTVFHAESHSDWFWLVDHVALSSTAFDCPRQANGS
mgnify:CR=1 FL=1